MHSERLRLRYLDGIRGLAALFVVAHHLHQELSVKGGLPRHFLAATKLLQLGHYAVALFIVLSGYSLMLPVARSADGRLRDGIWRYLLRRARRILPPYFAVLAFTLLLMLAIPAMRRPTGFSWDAAVPISSGAVLSHMLLIHNLNPAWVLKIDPPMWSVATEWQIYFAFPLVLLPLWRKLGVAITVLFAYGAGVGLVYWSGGQLRDAYPWYLGLFAAGMGAAVIGFSSRPSTHRVRQRIPWWHLVMAFGAALAVMIKLRPGWLALADALAGLAAASLLVACTTVVTSKSASRPIVLRIFESDWAVRLGAVSYTLYLIHSPLITLAHLALMKAVNLDAMRRLLLLPPVAIVIIVPVTLAFYFLFERPFVSSRRKAASPVLASTVYDPAI